VNKVPSHSQYRQAMGPMSSQNMVPSSSDFGSQPIQGHMYQSHYPNSNYCEHIWRNSWEFEKISDFYIEIKKKPNLDDVIDI
jgi:hypothetical protein